MIKPKYSIVETIILFHKETTKSHYRYNSWLWCYRFFKKLHQKKIFTNNDYDLAALNLGFYLASWGMYRGSAFLLQNDYKVHTYTCKAILNTNNFIWAKNWKNLNKSKILEKAEIIFEFTNTIKEMYEKHARDSEGNSKIIAKWDTLPTKILMGTTGIIPAYDDFFQKGLGKLKMTKKFGINSMLEIVDFYNDNIKDFNKAKIMTNDQYPSMKLVDMYFWIIGRKYA